MQLYYMRVYALRRTAVTSKAAYSSPVNGSHGAASIYSRAYTATVTPRDTSLLCSITRRGFLCIGEVVYVRFWILDWS